MTAVSLDLGIDGRRLVVPAGWTAIEWQPFPELGADLALGVVERPASPAFAASVLFVPPPEVATPVESLLVGQVVTDVRPSGAASIERVLLAASDQFGPAVVTARIWIDAHSRPLHLVLTVPADRFDTTWSDASAALESVLTEQELIALRGVLW